MKAAVLLSKIFFKIRCSRFKALSNASVVGSPIILQPTLLIGAGVIKFDDGVRVGWYPSPNFFDGSSYIEARNKTAIVEIGSGAIINNNFTLICDISSIKIGKNTLIGSNVTILDSDFHSIAPESRKVNGMQKFAPIVIGENVFIGDRVIILKGVKIGNDSVVAAGSIVIKDVPERSVVAGNPARIVKSF